MSLEEKVMTEMKEAMKAKDEAKLRGLRAIKAEIIKAKTEPGANGQISEEAELKMLQKMAKQRKDSLDIYKKQRRQDLAQKEEEEIAIIEEFLPAQLSQEQLKLEIEKVISEIGANSPADMGKVMAAASKKLGGSADGKTIAAVVKE